MITNTSALNKNRIINIELWTNENICDWLKGIAEAKSLRI